MRKIGLTLSKFTFLICSLIGISAQAANPEGGIRWALRAGWDVNFAGKWHKSGMDLPGYHTGTGATLGTLCNIPLSAKFFLEPGISLTYDTYSDEVILGKDELDEGTKSIDPTVYKAGFRIPIVFGYRINLTDKVGLKIFTGPELSYAFAGGVHLNDNDLKDELDLHIFGSGGYMRRFSAAWKAGVAVPFGNWQVGLEGAFGLNNVLTNGWTFRENRMNLSLALFL